MHIEQPEVVLVNLGVFQSYIIEAIRNLKLFDNRSITVIIDSHLSDHFKEITGIRLITTNELDLAEFEENSKLDESFRNGFWKHTSKRLFCLYQYMRKYDRENCFHIENDVMVYRNLSTILPKEKKVWLVMENPERSIPGIVFVPNYRSLNNLVRNYIYHKNDMVNMAHFFNSNRDICNAFPLIPVNPHYNENNLFTRHFESFDCIFDGAAIGHYLGGEDPRNVSGPRRKTVLSFLNQLGLNPGRMLQVDTRGKINRVCVVNFSHYQFAWKLVDGLFIPHIRVLNRWIQIVNLHIHCKWLQRFRADHPKETKFIPILK